jgi:hypothetical protein
MSGEHEATMMEIIDWFRQDAKRSGMSFDYQMENYEIMYRVWKDRIAVSAALFLCHEADQPVPWWLANAVNEMCEEIARKSKIN